MNPVRRYLSRPVRAGLLQSPLVPNDARVAGLRRLGVEIGDDVLVYPGVRFNGLDVHIGDRCLINTGCLFDGGPVRIEDDVALAPDVVLASVTHEIGGADRRAGENVWRQVTVERGAWIGARSIVLAGVTVARGCIVGAGSVVTRSTEPNGVYVGVPARRVRELD